MEYDRKFMEVLTQIIKNLINSDDNDIKDVEKSVIESLVEKGYALEEISDILADIFKITKTEKKKDIKMRVIHPAEIENLTEEAKNYLFLVKDIINENEFEDLLNSFCSTNMKITLLDLKYILEKRDIINNQLLN